jgi:predicted hydrolase (HD superfamily)
VRSVLCAAARQVRDDEAHWAVVGAPVDWDATVGVPEHHLRYGFGQLDVAAALARAALLP